MHRLLAIAAFAVLLLPACSMLRAPPADDAVAYKPDAVAQLRPGETTEAQTRRLFGEPQRVQLKNGDTIVGYSRITRSSHESAGDDARVEMLALRFGRDGKLVSYSLNTTVGE